MALIPQEDEYYLKEKGFKYEIKSEDSEIHVILKDWPFPEGYTPRTATILIRLLAGYPLSAVDMFWTIPDIKLASSGAWPEASEHHEPHGGQTWQRWSRHYVWRAGVDNLRTFITAVAAEINRGV